MISSMVVFVDSGEGGMVWRCTVCGKSLKHKGNLRDHVEAFHITGFTQTCDHCGKIFKSRRSLRTHIYAIHRGGPMGEQITHSRNWKVE